MDLELESVDTRRMALQEVELVLLTADLAGFPRATASMPAEPVDHRLPDEHRERQKRHAPTTYVRVR